jgi:hypothetical protein
MSDLALPQQASRAIDDVMTRHSGGLVDRQQPVHLGWFASGHDQRSS